MTMLQNVELLRSNLIKAVNSECDKMRSHLNATLLISKGTSIKTVQSLLGHSTAVTTVNTPKGHTPPTAAIFDIIVKIQHLVKRWVVLQEIF